jgi:hypothetical protein
VCLYGSGGVYRIERRVTYHLSGRPQSLRRLFGFVRFARQHLSHQPQTAAQAGTIKASGAIKPANPLQTDKLTWPKAKGHESL